MVKAAVTRLATEWQETRAAIEAYVARLHDAVDDSDLEEVNRIADEMDSWQASVANLPETPAEPAPTEPAPQA